MAVEQLQKLVHPFHNVMAAYRCGRNQTEGNRIKQQTKENVVLKTGKKLIHVAEIILKHKITLGISHTLMYVVCVCTCLYFQHHDIFILSLHKTCSTCLPFKDLYKALISVLRLSSPLHIVKTQSKVTT